jgi:hypothetical protein
MTVKCSEKRTCSFHAEKEICIFCQTKLKSVDRRLLEGDISERLLWDNVFDVQQQRSEY